MTDDKIAAIRERLNATTAGPWTWEQDRPGWATLYAGRDTHHHGLNLLGRLELDSNGAANLDFIAHAPEDIAALLEERDRLRAEVDRLTLNDIGDRAVAWTRREFGEQTLERDVLQLSEETGKVARAVGKASEGIRAHDRGNLAEELADVILAATKTARRQGIDLNAVVLQRLDRMESLRFNTSEAS